MLNNTGTVHWCGGVSDCAMDFPHPWLEGYIWKFVVFFLFIQTKSIYKRFWLVAMDRPSPSVMGVCLIRMVALAGYICWWFEIINNKQSIIHWSVFLLFYIQWKIVSVTVAAPLTAMSNLQISKDCYWQKKSQGVPE